MPQQAPARALFSREVVEARPAGGYTLPHVKPLALLLALLVSGCLATRPGPEPAAPQPEAAAAAPSAPAAADVPSPEAKTPEPPPPAPQPPRPAPAQPVPIPSEAALRRLLPAAARPYTPVQMQGRAVLLVQDVNRDGKPEILAPVAALAGSQVDPASLSDYSSVFVEGRQRVPFHLLVLTYEASGLAVSSRIDLGERYAFGGLTVVPLATSGPGPVALVASFPTRTGSEQEWLVFSGPSLRPVSRLALRDTLASRPKVEDIDRNGLIDIVVQESGFEVGVGFETLLTWYRWNGTRFVEQSVRNVVRNLRAFLASTRELLLARNWKALVQHCFASDQLLYYRGEGLSDLQIIVRGLGLTAHYDPARPESVLTDIADLVLPLFQENPFSATDERGSYFLLAYRIVESSGASWVTETPVYMMRNPFAERQFFFRIR